MTLTRRIAAAADRATTRLVRLEILVLALGIPLFGAFYLVDQHVDAGPSLVQRQVQAAERRVRTAPNSIQARLQLALAYRQDSRLDDALRQYDEILRAEGSHRAALLGRGGVLMAKGDLDSAAAAFRTITGAASTGEFAGADPQLAEAHYFLGSIALTQGKVKAALAELQAALKIDQTDADAWYLLGLARLKDGAAERAVPAFRRALLFVPTGWCEPYSQLAVAYSTLRQAPQAEYAASMVDFCQKRPAEAKRRLQALAAGPVAVDAMLGLGMIAESSSERAEAVGWYRRVLAADAANIGARSALSRLGVRPTPAGPAAAGTG
ncbi:MAG: tetratricopeptide repeat protein [Actinobacteria bacterium]|nr:tetratricopeptide repeat protein [Actinomycetota bacterium]MBI3686870.1 tetratricopeptide repeat protein [Actinomycetota bacterium]